LNQAQVDEKLHQLDVIFVIDSTGSMSPAISTVQTRLQSFAAALAGAPFQPSVAIGVVAYRDHPPEDQTFVVRVHPLTEDLEVAQANVNRLLAAGGGDGAEAALDGVHAALHNLEPRKFAHRVIILVGDAPPHGAGGKRDRWPMGCPCGLTILDLATDAIEQGVAIHTVGVGNDQAMIESFRELAMLSGGTFVPLAELSTLIPRALDLLGVEMAKMAADEAVFDTLIAAPDNTPAVLAALLGRSEAEVSASMDRLRAKGVLNIACMHTEDLVNVLLSVDPTAPPPIALEEVDPDIMARIQIDDGAEPTLCWPVEDIEIRILA
jgi:Mg-chelatase subunit ChlD